MPIDLPHKLTRCVLAMGAGIKNTIAVAWGRRAVLSAHLGDLDSPEAYSGFKQAVTLLPRFLDRRPEAVAVDVHPDLQSTRLGEKMACKWGVPILRIQHHYAHAAACLAENGRSTGLALVFDGTGLGLDGTIWGAELIHVHASGFDRLATFVPTPLPGGDAALRHPVRQLIARWQQAGVATNEAWLTALGISEEQCDLWRRQTVAGLNAPLSSGAGRVFDAVAVALGAAPLHVTYDGQPAIRLEALARQASPVPLAGSGNSYNTLKKNGMLWIDWSPLFVQLGAVGPSKTPDAVAASAFHTNVALAALDMVAFGLSLTGERSVALSGGVFMNSVLNERLIYLLAARGIEALVHRLVPPNDGGIALGQAAVSSLLSA